MTKKRKEYMKK